MFAKSIKNNFIAIQPSTESLPQNKLDITSQNNIPLKICTIEKKFSKITNVFPVEVSLKENLIPIPSN